MVLNMGRLLMWLVYRAISANPVPGGQLPNRHVPSGGHRSHRHPSGRRARNLGSGRRTDRSVVSGMLGKWSWVVSFRCDQSTGSVGRFGGRWGHCPDCHIT